MTATFTPICWVGSYEIWYINDDYFFILHNEVLMEKIDLSLSCINMMWGQQCNQQCYPERMKINYGYLSYDQFLLSLKVVFIKIELLIQSCHKFICYLTFDILKQ